MSDMRDREPYDSVFKPDHKHQMLTVNLDGLFSAYYEEGEPERVPSVFKWKDGSLIPEMIFPGVYEVCNVCRGIGTVVDPRIDRNGLSEDQTNDLDFMDDYRSGFYDISCNECKGRRVVLRVDLGTDPRAAMRIMLNHINAELDDRARCAAEMAHTMRMESGGYC